MTFAQSQWFSTPFLRLLICQPIFNECHKQLTSTYSCHHSEFIVGDPDAATCWYHYCLINASDSDVIGMIVLLILRRIHHRLQSMCSVRSSDEITLDRDHASDLSAKIVTFIRPLCSSSEVDKFPASSADLDVLSSPLAALRPLTLPLLLWSVNRRFNSAIQRVYMQALYRPFRSNFDDCCWCRAAQLLSVYWQHSAIYMLAWFLRLNDDSPQCWTKAHTDKHSRILDDNELRPMLSELFAKWCISHVGEYNYAFI